MKRRTLLGGAIAAIFAPQAIATSSDQRIMQSLAATLELANKMNEVRQQRIFDNNLCKEILYSDYAPVGPKEGDVVDVLNPDYFYEYHGGAWVKKPFKLKQSGPWGTFGPAS